MTGTVTPAIDVMANQELADRAAAALAGQSYVSDKLIRIEAGNDHIVLHGRVRSYFHKQMAQETLRRVAGVKSIENRMTVEWAE